MKIKDRVVKGRILIELRKKRGNKGDFINQKVYKRRSVNRLFYFLWEYKYISYSSSNIYNFVKKLTISGSRSLHNYVEYYIDKNVNFVFGEGRKSWLLLMY